MKDRDTTKSPDTVSAGAREIIAANEPFDLGRPATPAEWAALRDELRKAFDFADILRAEYDFSTRGVMTPGIR